MVMEGVWSSHTEAALLILGLGSILTRQYLRAAKAWQVQGEGRGGPTCPHWRVNPIKKDYPTTKSELVVQLQQLTSRSM